MAISAFRVIWAEPAASDLAAIVGFIAQDSPLNARKVLARLRQKADSLASLPWRGRAVPELRDLGLDSLRELIAKPYRLIYRVDEDRVTVLAVLDGRRHLEDILYERLLRQS